MSLEELTKAKELLTNELNYYKTTLKNQEATLHELHGVIKYISNQLQNVQKQLDEVSVIIPEVVDP